MKIVYEQAAERPDASCLFDYAALILQEVPTVDAAEVTRCRDCKYYEIHKPKVLENCERNGYIIPMEPDDFCSYGERRDGDVDGRIY